MTDLEVLLTREQIATRVAEIGADITSELAGEPVVLLAVLKGATVFLADLARHIQLDVSFDFIGVTSYTARPSPEQELKHGWDSTGEARLTKYPDQPLAGKNIIVVEDILDTGMTLNFLKKIILAHKPRSFRIVSLLDKPSRRKEPIQADYVGFTIPDEFVVGYGLDYAEQYRNLPDIRIIPRV